MYRGNGISAVSIYYGITVGIIRLAGQEPQFCRKWDVLLYFSSNSSFFFLSFFFFLSSSPCHILEHYFRFTQVDVRPVSMFLYISTFLQFRLTTALSFCSLSSRIRLNHRVLCLSISIFPLNSSSDAQITPYCCNSDLRDKFVCTFAV